MPRGGDRGRQRETREPETKRLSEHGSSPALILFRCSFSFPIAEPDAGPASSICTTAFPPVSASIPRGCALSRRKLTGGEIVYGQPHRITISAHLSPSEQEDTLRHEAAHAWAWRFEGSRAAHGPLFRTTRPAPRRPGRARSRHAGPAGVPRGPRPRRLPVPRLWAALPPLPPVSGSARVPRMPPRGPARPSRPHRTAPRRMNPERKGLLLVAAAALLWSTGGIGIKWLSQPPLVIAFYRSATAAVALFAIFRPRVWRWTPAFLVGIAELRGVPDDVRARHQVDLGGQRDLPPVLRRDLGPAPLPVRPEGAAPAAATRPP